MIFIDVTFFQWKGKLIIGSYRACDDPVPGNAECLGGVQDVPKAVTQGKVFVWKMISQASETHSLPPPS